MGAFTGYVVNTTDSLKYSKIQNANDSASTTAGDALTIYSLTAVANGTVGATITDLGCQVTLDVDDATITASHQYEGMYIVMTNGTNVNKHYVIIDSTEAATDTITLAVDATTGFTANTDTFKIIDRIYDEKSYPTANVALTTSGNASSFIKWDASGTLVIDALSQVNYNIYGGAGLTGVKFTNSAIFANYLTSLFGGVQPSSNYSSYYRWGNETVTAASSGNWSNGATWPNGIIPGVGQVVVIPNGITVTVDDPAITVGDGTTTSAITVDQGGTLQIDTTEAENRVITVKGDITVNGTLRLRSNSNTSYSTTIKFDCTANGEFGLIVTATGLLDVLGTSLIDQDVIITANTQDNAHNAYIYCQDGSQTSLKYADISYMGMNTNLKFGIYVESVDAAVSGEYFYMDGCNIHNSYQGIRTGGGFADFTGYPVIVNNTFGTCSSTGINFERYTRNALVMNNIVNTSYYGVLIWTGSYNNLIKGNVISNSTYDGVRIGAVNSDNNRVYNNTFYNCGRDSIYVDVGVNNSLISNNIISNNLTGSAINDTGTGTVINYNMFYNNNANGTTGTNSITGT
ncbi:MAG: hypothetical protein ACD_79C01348G0001, partial [uncultured bacterium]